ncbi:MAG: heavy metal translocating P-type ATPase [Betaproteobacteria bacterium]
MSAVTCSVCEVHAESTFKVEGMDCREEVEMLERRFRNLAGLEDFSADLVNQRLHVKYDAARLNDAAITAAVADAGMRAWLEHEEPVGSGVAASRWRPIVLGIAGATLAAGLALQMSGAPVAATRAVLAVSVVAGAALTARRAWHAVRLRSLDINVLMMIAAAGAVVLDQWAEAGAVVFLFAVAQAMEVRTLERARNAIRGLMDLTPTDALVREAGGERHVSADLVEPGALIVVRPGEKIPLDGQVVAGESAVNQAPVTGESLPAEKRPGDEVFAGTINGRGALDVRVTRGRRDTTLARIIHLVERAQASRAPAQSFVERFARVYTPAVIGLAIVVAVVPPLVAGAAWEEWIYRALVLLVVSCPCALVISTPVSIVAALAGAARKGVLIKGGAHLERAGHVRCIAFDKTGTLTHGHPEVVDVIALDGLAPDAIVAMAASVEQRSTHPIAEAILRHAKAGSLTVPPGEGVQALSGRGAEGQVAGSPVLLGNHRLFEERRLCSPALHPRLEALARAGRTAVLVACDNRTVGIIALADRPRENGRDTLDLLRRQGIESIVLLTGDTAGTARALAEAVGVDEVRADLLPEDKVSAVEELRRRYGPVAMVGDGINDAPALATADVGIAMGVAGSDTALETADVALMADELLKIPYAIRLSRAAVRNIQANLGISLVMKAAFVVAAVTGVATLWMAVLADTGASVLVVANALRLLRAD